MAVNENEVVDIGRKERKLSFSKEELETLKRTVAKDANPDEFKMFLYLAKTYKLDPFAKEIFFWKIDGDPVIMTSRDGYLSIANNNPNYDGLVSDVIRENDKFVKKTDTVEHQYGTKRGQIVGAYALVYRSDRKYPAYAFAPFEEYNAHTHIWKKYPSLMIQKCSESMALKRAFSVSGLVSREEMQVSQDDNNMMEVTDIDQESKNNSTARNVHEINDTTTEDNNEQLTEKEEIIKDLVDGNQELRKELFDYLKYAKEENELDKVSIDDLTGSQFSELKGLLEKIKNMMVKSA